MYVCLCNGLKEVEFRELARKHPDADAEEVYALMDAEPHCGTCMSYIREERAKIRQTPDPGPVPDFI